MTSKRCAFPGCGKRTSLHRLSKDPATREKWLQFIYKECPSHVDPELRVCSVHFSADCFENRAQYDAGFAKKLVLKNHAVPTGLNPSGIPQTSPSRVDVDCQTDTPHRRSVFTQLSYSTLRSYRSKGTQTDQATTTVGVDSTTQPTTSQLLASTPLKDKRPSKRPRLEFEEGEESFSFEACDPQDTTSDPALSVTTSLQFLV